MPRRSKWLKWQVGAGATALLTLLFHSVRSDAAFDAAHQDKLNAQNTASTVQDEPNADDEAFREFINERRQQGQGNVRNPRGGRFQRHNEGSSRGEGDYGEQGEQDGGRLGGRNGTVQPNDNGSGQRLAPPSGNSGPMATQPHTRTRRS